MTLEIVKSTLSHYEERAQDFWEGTKDHDVSQNYQNFLKPFGEQKGLKILDFGCGPGRDLISFKKMGHHPIGLDGTASFCQMAKENSGCEVWQQDFLNLDLGEKVFDGIFANASLFHVPSKSMPEVLRKLKMVLKPQGVLFTSNPRGEGEGAYDRRWGVFYEKETYFPVLEKAGFKILNFYYRPTHSPPEEQNWLATVAQKVDSK